jgi:DNA-binding response OmpR family regulator
MLFFQKRVLVIDGEYSITQLLKEWFEINGFLAETAETRLEAIKMVSLRSYDIVVLGFPIISENDFELISDMRKSCPETIIIGMSGLWWQEEHYLEAGANYFVAKPFHFSAFDFIVSGKCS